MREHLGKGVFRVVLIFLAVVTVAASLIYDGSFGDGSGTKQVVVNNSERADRVVILVPGYGGEIEWLDKLAATFRSYNYEVQYAAIGDNRDDLDRSGRVLRSQIREAKHTYSVVDLVGLSAGGLVIRSALTASSAAEAVDHVVTLASPHHGTDLLASPEFPADLCMTACEQMMPSSEYVRSLPSPRYPNRWLNLWSASDEILIPVKSASWDAVTSYEISCGASWVISSFPGEHERSEWCRSSFRTRRSTHHVLISRTSVEPTFLLL